MDQFELGVGYTRALISEKLGGSTRAFLPHVKGRVVCGCFRKDLNERAPSEVLPGVTEDMVRWARVFASQQEPVPVFMQKKSGEWIYEGTWKIACPPIEDPVEIATLASYSARRDISMILRLEHVAEPGLVLND